MDCKEYWEAFQQASLPKIALLQLSIGTSAGHCAHRKKNGDLASHGFDSRELPAGSGSALSGRTCATPADSLQLVRQLQVLQAGVGDVGVNQLDRLQRRAVSEVSGAIVRSF